MGGSNSVEINVRQDLHNYISTTITNLSNTVIETTSSTTQSAVIDAVAAYEIWSKMNPRVGDAPKCDVRNINLDSVVKLKTDTNSQKKIVTELESKLKSISEQIATNKFDEPIGILNKIDSSTLSTIQNNITNVITNQEIENIVNSAIVSQSLFINCGYDTKVNGITIKSSVDLIASNVLQKLVNNTNLASLDSDASQLANNTVSGIFSQLGNMLSGILGSPGGIIIMMIVLLFLAYVVIKKIGSPSYSSMQYMPPYYPYYQY